MTMRHGRKAELIRFAKELRLEVGAPSTGAFDPGLLAAEYGIPVVGLSQLDAESAEYFAEAGRGRFSGMTLQTSQFGRMIVLNDAHLPVRQRSTLGHEVAHIVCEHPHALTLGGNGRCYVSGAEQEDEADFLSGELLVPIAVAREAVIRGISPEEIAVEYEVSVQMARWRMNKSGGRQIRSRMAQRAR